MNNITKFSNLIKYDFNKCTQCRKCVYSCKTRALSLYNGVIEYNDKKCISCKKCIDVCDTHSLYYNVNDGIMEGDNTIAIIPYNADQKFLNKKYGNIITYEMGEKVKIIETAFEMESLTSRKIDENNITPLIISDVSNFDLILKVKFPKLMKYYSQIKNPYYIASYLEKMKNNNKNLKIVAYGIPFENKKYFENIQMIDELCDIPYKNSLKYNVLDVLNAYKDLCKFDSSVNLNELEVSNNLVIKMSNKTVDVKVLFIKEINNLSSIEINKFDFIFVCAKDKYYLNDSLLKDEEINKLYKSKLKSPGKTIAFFYKE